MNLRLALPIVFAFAFPNFVLPVQAQVVPGTGQQIIEAFDDFEDPEWTFTLNLPKSSANIDKIERHPAGFSTNRTYLESMYRGTPDFVRRVETPAGGIPGSKGSLAMQTLNSGIPGQTSTTFQQDDLIAGVQQKLGFMMPVSWTPSYVCRVYIPPFEKWERRHGSHFGFRADCTTTITKTTSIGRLFKNIGSRKALEQYWPGFFVQLNLKQSTGQAEDYAQIVMRSDDRGHEVPGPKITHAGWWTLGMSFTPDGKVHYYAREGVASLTSRDHLYSSFPYGYNCEQTSTFFFNIVNQDDGRSWSTRWIVDDPKAFVATGSYRPPQPVAQKPAATAQAKPADAKPAAVTQPVPPVTAAAPATPVATAPAALPATTPVAATVPALPIPKLASKPTDVPVVAPNADNVNPDSASKTPVPETKSEETKPAAAPTVTEEQPKPATPPVAESSAKTEPVPESKTPPVAETPPTTEVPPTTETPPNLETPAATEKPAPPAEANPPAAETPSPPAETPASDDE